jgi:glycosyltransferase involved in cell wall biosynthesis
MKNNNIYVVVPVFNEGATIKDLITTILKVGKYAIIVVNDGSTDNTHLQVPKNKRITLIKQKNQGKSTALIKGFKEAIKRKATAVVTIDGDGQHNPWDIKKLTDAHKQNNNALIIAARKKNKKSSIWHRRFANRFADFWIGWATGKKIIDSQCGLRLYPITLLKKIIHKKYTNKSFVFESEVIILSVDLKIPIIFVTTSYNFNNNSRPSHFQNYSDIKKITKMVSSYIFVIKFSPIKLYKSIFGKTCFYENDKT